MENINFKELQAQIVGCGPQKSQPLYSASDSHQTHSFFTKALTSSFISNNTVMKSQPGVANATNVCTSA